LVRVDSRSANDSGQPSGLIVDERAPRLKGRVTALQWPLAVLLKQQRASDTRDGVRQGVMRDIHLAALPAGAQEFGRRGLPAFMRIGDHEPHASQAAGDQRAAVPRLPLRAAGAQTEMPRARPFGPANRYNLA
jgi:hypothetical protein